ncbi:MAG TPA: phosphodiester glycosidase family protein [Rhodothermales bacterium]|nr:phosphodiester glycosidase family protein [Rhodothermales bacterium]
MWKRQTTGACLLLLLLVAGCTHPQKPSAQPAPLSLTWHPIDSLQARLPEGIRVYAGQSETPPLRAWYAHIDEPSPHITTRVVVSDDTTDNREATSSFARDLEACVVVNGGYFTMDKTPAGHVGLLYVDHQIREAATRSVQRDDLRFETARAAIGFEGDNLQITWATTRNDTLYRWPTPPPHQPGHPAAPLSYTDAQPWTVRDALGTGPMLLVGGEMRVTSDAEVFFGTSIPEVHPRTAAGITAEGNLIVMVVDGRQEASRGVSLEELAALMRDVGAVDALNLDGGGSSTMVVQGVRLNLPTGGEVEREVMSALATFCD